MTRQINFPTVLKNHILSLRRKGLGWKKIAGLVHQDAHTIRRHVKAWGDPGATQYSHYIIWSPDLDAELIRLRSSGLKWQIMVEKMGITRNTLQRRIRFLEGENSPLLRRVKNQPTFNIVTQRKWRTRAKYLAEHGEATLASPPFG